MAACANTRAALQISFSSRTWVGTVGQ